MFCYTDSRMAQATGVFLVHLVLLLACVQCEDALKDVLFIAVDDLRPQLGCYGDNLVNTPNIDLLATQSMVFERAYCQVAVCSPSRTSLLTGRRPDTNHVWRDAGDEYWRRVTNATTIPQYFKENGYRSIGMGKVFHPGAASGNDDIAFSWSLPYFHGVDKVPSNHTTWHSIANISDSALQDGQIADNAIEIMKQIKLNRTMGDATPFFLAAGFHKPHLPFYVPSSYYDLYPPSAEFFMLPLNPYPPVNLPDIAWTTSLELRHHSDMEKYDSPECQESVEALAGLKCRLSETDTRKLRRGYHAAQSYSDAQIGRVLSQMDLLGLADNTIVVLWGDHGFKLGEHDMWTKHANFEDDTRVPLMVRVPGVTDKAYEMRTDALVELVDIFPSLTELAGLDVPPLCPEGDRETLACSEGVSFVPLLADPKRAWKDAAFSQYPRPAGGLNSIPNRPPFNPFNGGEDVMGYSMRVDQYRFVEWYSFDRETGTPDFSTIWGTELYEHSLPTRLFDDENINLATQADTRTVIQLREMVQDGWRAVMPEG